MKYVVIDYDDGINLVKGADEQTLVFEDSTEAQLAADNCANGIVVPLSKYLKVDEEASNE